MSKPLTLEQLKALPAGEWVWIKRNKCDGIYAEKSGSSDGIHFVAHYGGAVVHFEYEDYQKDNRFGWTAWKNKEQEFDDGGDIRTYKKALVLAVCKFHDACDILGDIHGTDIAIEQGFYMQDEEGDYYSPLDMNYFIEQAEKL